MSSIKPTEKLEDVLGLPGLKSIREALNIRQDVLAAQVGRTNQWISQIETGKDDCTQALQRKLARVLCCKVVDLLEEPTPERLAEIKDESEYQKGQEAAARIAAREAEQQKGVA